jgi:hypothetical protein
MTLVHSGWRALNRKVVDRGQLSEAIEYWDNVIKIDPKHVQAYSNKTIFVLVGMMFLVPAITEKALAAIYATAKGVCGPEGQTHPCEFTLVSKTLDEGIWNSKPTESGTLVKWSTTGSVGMKIVGNEKGSVTYNVGVGQQKETAVLSFENPLSGSNKCDVTGIGGSCTAGKGLIADFTYNLRGK